MSENPPHLTNSTYEDSSVSINDSNTFHGDVVIGKGAKLIKKYPDKPITYPVEKENFAFLELIAKFVVDRVGDTKALIVSVVTTIAGALGAFNLNTLGIYFVYLSWGVFFIGIILLASIIHKHFVSKCPSCKKHYAIDPIGQPTVTEIKVAEGVRKITNRDYKCKFCGYKFTTTNTDLLENPVDNEINDDD
ncbi:MAG: hypothetical protein WC462_00070 [archaeon]